MAQLVAHLHGMQGVRGSSPLRSTTFWKGPESMTSIRGPSVCAAPLCARAGVRSATTLPTRGGHSRGRLERRQPGRRVAGDLDHRDGGGNEIGVVDELEDEPVDGRS